MIQVSYKMPPNLVARDMVARELPQQKFDYHYLVKYQNFRLIQLQKMCEFNRRILLYEKSDIQNPIVVINRRPIPQNKGGQRHGSNNP